jgi:hypothetical protein
VAATQLACIGGSRLGLPGGGADRRGTSYGGGAPDALGGALLSSSVSSLGRPRAALHCARPAQSPTLSLPDDCAYLPNVRLIPAGRHISLHAYVTR